MALAIQDIMPEPEPDPRTERLLKVREIAARLGVAQPTVLRWLREGSLHGLRVGNSYRVRESELRRYLEREQW